MSQTTVACKNLKTNEKVEGNLEIIIIRQQRLIDTIFTASVATFVSIIYINFGCAINWSDLPKILKKTNRASHWI
ncbi:hypothetical protein NQ314_008743 [Rhamnusium bicolor]|uniref:Uncharacterized protein n=1 Tax=Rhamnusium bicolor TaxID=1586634 RepID=A0AAV8Y9I3_9CUCU|nr:hypothetical protein NQ314_008743 [Rhamnusium bicolor]